MTAATNSIAVAAPRSRRAARVSLPSIRAAHASPTECELVVAHVTKLPLVTVVVLTDAGAVCDADGSEGTAQLTARMLLEGTRVVRRRRVGRAIRTTRRLDRSERRLGRRGDHDDDTGRASVECVRLARRSASSPAFRIARGRAAQGRAPRRTAAAARRTARARRRAVHTIPVQADIAIRAGRGRHERASKRIDREAIVGFYERDTWQAERRSWLPATSRPIEQRRWPIALLVSGTEERRRESWPIRGPRGQIEPYISSRSPTRRNPSFESDRSAFHGTIRISSR